MGAGSSMVPREVPSGAAVRGVSTSVVRRLAGATVPADPFASSGRVPSGACGPGVPDPSPAAIAASTAARIAATWAGVVPQQPPMMRAPAASASGTTSPHQAASAA